MPYSTPKVDDPGYWRFLALNTRKLAKDVNEEKSKSIIIHISMQYEELAHLAEKRGRSRSS